MCPWAGSPLLAPDQQNHNPFKRFPIEIAFERSLRGAPKTIGAKRLLRPTPRRARGSISLIKTLREAASSQLAVAPEDIATAVADSKAVGHQRGAASEQVA